jgi:hypothetical protein
MMHRKSHVFARFVWAKVNYRTSFIEWKMYGVQLIQIFRQYHANRAQGRDI